MQTIKVIDRAWQAHYVDLIAYSSGTVLTGHVCDVLDPVFSAHSGYLLAAGAETDLLRIDHIDLQRLFAGAGYARRSEAA